jgi:hypothetical protein
LRVFLQVEFVEDTMRKLFLAATVAALAALPYAAQAANSTERTVTGAAIGGTAGAVVAGPVGAVVGGTAGGGNRRAAGEPPLSPLLARPEWLSSLPLALRRNKMKGPDRCPGLFSYDASRIIRMTPEKSLPDSLPAYFS